MVGGLRWLVSPRPELLLVLAIAREPDDGQKKNPWVAVTSPLLVHLRTSRASATTHPAMAGMTQHGVPMVYCVSGIRRATKKIVPISYVIRLNIIEEMLGSTFNCTPSVKKAQGLEIFSPRRTSPLRHLNLPTWVNTTGIG